MTTAAPSRTPIRHRSTGLTSLDRINAEADAATPLVAVEVPTSRVPGSSRTCAECSTRPVNWSVRPARAASSDDRRADVCTVCLHSTYVPR